MRRYRESKMVAETEILKRLVADHEDLTDGPNLKALLEAGTKHPDMQGIVSAVAALGNHSMLMGRAFAELGLIPEVEKVEPGAKVTGKTALLGLPSRGGIGAPE